MRYVRQFFDILNTYPGTSILLGLFILAIVFAMFAWRINVEKRSSEMKSQDEKWNH